MVVMEVMRVVENGDHEPPSVLQTCRSTQAAGGLANAPLETLWRDMRHRPATLTPRERVGHS